jgi:glycosyltransferase involved in cell wall biosynthesis
MSDRIRQTILAVRRWLLLGSLCFSRLLTVRVARAVLSELSLDVDTEPSGPRQLLADVSVISQSDAGTGIQRVVRELLRELIANPPPGYDVKPVYASRRGYSYAQQYGAALMGHDLRDIAPRPVHVHAGDVFLGLDLASYSLVRHHRQISRWKIAGVKFFFVVHDLLPALHPEWFTAIVVKDYLAWIRTVAIYADGAICVSMSVSNDLQEWLDNQLGTLSPSVSVGWFHLGGDISASIPSRGKTTGFDELLRRVGKRTSVLVVGTIEPRKGHAQTLSAFEMLWRQGQNINLVIVGKAGWKVDELVSRLRNHPEAGNRLIWLDDATDEMLCALYGAVDGLLIASEGEGFGLSIVEAAQYGKPILARDIPVFREIAGDHAQFFSGNTPDELAVDIRHWLDLLEKGAATPSREMSWLTWEASARQLSEKIISMAH